MLKSIASLPSLVIAAYIIFFVAIISFATNLCRERYKLQQKIKNSNTKNSNKK